MKTMVLLSPEEADAVAEQLLLTAMLVYEDMASGLRAKAALDRLMDQVPMEGNCGLDIWPFALLDSPRVQQAAAQAAARADVVALSLHGNRPLGPTIKAWLECWLNGGAKKHQALIVLFDGDYRDTPETTETTLHLYRAAEQRVLDVFVGFSDSQPKPAPHMSTPLPRWPTTGFPLPAEMVRRLDRI